MICFVFFIQKRIHIVMFREVLALRVPQAETRLTVYRLSQVLVRPPKSKTNMQSGEILRKFENVQNYF